MQTRPADFDVRDPYFLMGSAWRSMEAETIARNVILTQQMLNPDQWTPFTWEQYISLCKHQVTDRERGVLEALVNGGRPVGNTSANLQAGYLLKDADGKYSVTPKFIKVVTGCLAG